LDKEREEHREERGGVRVGRIINERGDGRGEGGATICLKLYPMPPHAYMHQKSCIIGVLKGWKRERGEREERGKILHHLIHACMQLML
jgi:hypothetical protein